MLELVEDGLSVYRITRILTTDRIGQPYRDWMAKQGETAEYYSQCSWCTSVAVAAGVLAVSQFAPKAWRPVARALASSAITGLIAQNL